MGLYRGKLIKNGEWVEGSLLLFPGGIPYICYYIDDVDCVGKDEVIPATVGQYTGLKY